MYRHNYFTTDYLTTSETSVKELQKSWARIIAIRAQPINCQLLIVNCQLEQPHAGGDSQAGCDSRQNGDYRLNDEFPGFFFHNFSHLVV